MITDKNSPAYKLSLELVRITSSMGIESAQKEFHKRTNSLKFWEKMAIKETYIQLMKGVN